MALRARAQQDKPAARAPAASKNAAGAGTASATRMPSPAVAAAILAGAQRSARVAPRTPEHKPPGVHATPPPRRSEAPPPVAAKPALAVVPAAEKPAEQTPAVQPAAKPKPASGKPAVQAAAPVEAGSAASPGKPGEAPADKAAEPKGQKPAPAGEGTKGAPAEAPEDQGGAAGKAAPLELKMPAPPAGPSPATMKRIGGVKARAGGAASAKAALPPGEVQAGGARQAVNQPDAEAKAKAQADLVAALGSTPAPSPEIIKLCERIREVIRNKRPPDEDALMEAKPDEEAKNAGSQLNSTVEGETKKVQGSYAPINNPPAGAAPAQGEQLPGQPDAAATKPVGAAAARPDAVPDAAVSLDADAEASKKKIDDAGMNKPAAQLVTSGPVAEARGAEGELAQAAKEDPAKVLDKQKETLAKAEGNMVALQQQALTALTAARAGTAKGATGQQEGMVVSEEAKRTKASADAQQIFTDAQKAVAAQLDPLARNALDKWEAAKEVLVSQFKADLAPVQRRVDERHSGASGFVVGLWDAVTGLPGWAVEGYDRAELNFSEGVIAKLKEISAEVNGVIAICELLIKTARDRIARIFADLGGNLTEWAAQEQAKFDKKLDGLQQQAIATRDNFNKDLMDGAKQAVDEVRAEISELRKKAGGLVGRIASAIGRFLDDPVKFIIEGLLELLGIPPAAFWAVVAKIKKVVKEIADDPMKFANNLLKGLAEGFGKFFENFGTHMLKGFLSWLLGGLKDVQVPKDVSVRSIITFFLQIMGITWPNIRKILVKLIGAKNVALIEKVYSLVTLLIEKGPEGIYEMIKDKLDPQTIVDQVVSMAVDYMVTAIMKQVAVRIVMLFNPAGAILQALEAIYRVLKWIFQNAARIFTLVETVVNGIADILAGNVGGFAVAVEKALGMLIAPVISFIADYLSLGDLPGIVAEKVKAMREWILGMVEKALTWLIEKGKALLAAVGIGKKDDKKDSKKGKPNDEGVGEEIPFEAQGESHRLWIDVRNGDAEVMVASKTQTLSAYLADAKRVAGNDPTAGPHITGALTIMARLGPDADKLAAKLAKRAAQPDEAAEAGGDAQVTQEQATVHIEEESLVEHLKVIFDVLNPIQAAIGLNIETLAHAPFGYTCQKIENLLEIRRAHGFGGADEKRFPLVHTTYDGIITLGAGPHRIDIPLIDTFRQAVGLAKDRLMLDGAPTLDGDPEKLVKRLGTSEGGFNVGNRSQMLRFIAIVLRGEVATGSEVDLGKRRSVDHTLRVREGGDSVNIAVEYKHWTGTLEDDTRKKRVASLRNQLRAQITQLGSQPGKFNRLRVEWTGFESLDALSRDCFTQVLQEAAKLAHTKGLRLTFMVPGGFDWTEEI
jgi:hypothetical protein